MEVDKKAGCFGMVGKHYDFTIEVHGTHGWGGEAYLDGVDRLGRKILLHLGGEAEIPPLTKGESVFFRGKVLAHDELFGMPFTLIAAASDLNRVSEAV